jgi:hypothetical protein
MRLVRLTGFALLSACSLSGPDTRLEPLAALSAAAERWHGSGVTDYELTMKRSCGECLPTSALRVTVSVLDDMKTVTRADDGIPVEAPPGTYPDVPELFDLIEEMLLAGADVEAQYDSELGYPRSVAIDPVPGIVDEEFGFVVEEFRVGPHAALRTELAAQRAKWARSGFTFYQLTLRRSCFCGPGAAGTVLVNVFDRVPLEWHYFLTGEPVSEDLQPHFPGVDGLFDFIEEAIGRGAESIVVRFDPDLGLPQEIFVDYRFAVADEEVGYDVEKVLPFDAGEEPGLSRSAR